MFKEGGRGSGMEEIYLDLAQCLSHPKYTLNGRSTHTHAHVHAHTHTHTPHGQGQSESISLAKTFSVSEQAFSGVGSCLTLEASKPRQWNDEGTFPSQRNTWLLPLLPLLLHEPYGSASLNASPERPAPPLPCYQGPGILECSLSGQCQGGPRRGW